MTAGMERDAAVTEAVERLYQVFARCPLPSQLDASPLRDADAILRALRSAPLRSLGAEQVLPYAAWAMTTVGGADEYRHFLPRIFELALDHPPYLGAEPWVIAGKVEYPLYRDCWSEEERTAVRTAFLAALGWTLTQHPDRGDALEWFEGSCALGAISDALEFWKRSTSPYAVPYFAALVADLHRRERGDVVSQAIREEVLAWFGRPDVRRWFDAFPIPDDPWLLYEMESAYEILAFIDAEANPAARAERS